MERRIEEGLCMIMSVAQIHPPPPPTNPNLPSVSTCFADTKFLANLCLVCHAIPVSRFGDLFSATLADLTQIRIMITQYNEKNNPLLLWIRSRFRCHRVLLERLCGKSGEGKKIKLSHTWYGIACRSKSTSTSSVEPWVASEGAV